jgi:hypothetical protein
MKMNGLFVATYPTFIKPIAERLSGLHNCRLVNEFDPSKEMPVDFIWVDFLTEEAIKVQQYVTNAKKILRIHNYELYTTLLESLRPREWDAIIFISDRMKDRFTSIMGEHDNCVVIPNYLDYDKFSLKETGDSRGKKIVYAGYYTRRKGIYELYQLARMMPDYEFHLAGKPQEPDVWEYMNTNCPPNVFINQWQSDLNAFYKDKDFFFLASTREGFCCSMMEAMVCGLTPVTNDWIGVEEFYPAECIWHTLDEAKSIIENSTRTPEENNDWAKKHSGEGLVIDTIRTLVEKPKKDMVLPSLTVGIVQTRKKYMPALMHSLSMQDYAFNIMIVDNLDKEKPIGKCFNELARNCNTDFLLYLGDDDILTEDYIPNVMHAYARRQNAHEVVGVLTGTTYFDNNGNRAYSTNYPTGFWRPEYVRTHPFDETLTRQVDTAFIENSIKNNHPVLRMPWIIGYCYRQHEKNISGNKFAEGVNNSQEPEKDI